MNLEHVNSIDPGAVCNDGSTGGYYISHSTSSLFQNIWLLYLEGLVFLFCLLLFPGHLATLSEVRFFGLLLRQLGASSRPHAGFPLRWDVVLQ